MGQICILSLFFFSFFPSSRLWELSSIFITLFSVDVQVWKQISPGHKSKWENHWPSGFACHRCWLFLSLRAPSVAGRSEFLPWPWAALLDGFGSCRAIEKPCRKCLPIVAVWCLFSCYGVSLLCFLAIGLDLDLPLYSGCTFQAYVCLPGSDACSLCEV